MQQNKVRTYIFYALGEIFLVVVGIIIAIQVSNWNEVRILKESANYHLSLLVSDLKEDRVLLLKNVNIFEANKESIERLLNALMGLEAVSDEVPSDLVKLQLEYSFNPRKSGLEVLLNSGEIGALDVGIQNLITTYYLAVDALIERDRITNAYIMSKYETHIFDEYSYVFGPGNKFDVLATIYQNDIRPDIVINEEQFLSDRKLEALVVARVYQNQVRTELYNDALHKLEDLQMRIMN